MHADVYVIYYIGRHVLGLVGSYFGIYFNTLSLVIIRLFRTVLVGGFFYTKYAPKYSSGYFQNFIEQKKTFKKKL